jgi:AraC family transcriptional regulator
MDMKQFCEILTHEAIRIKSRSVISAEDGQMDFRFTTVRLIAKELQPCASSYDAVIMHTGAPVKTHCVLDGKSQIGIRRPGDFSIFPAGALPCRQGNEPAEVFHMIWTPRFVRSVLGETADMPLPSLKLRDPHLQGITSALMTEHLMPSSLGKIYTESLMTAFVVRLATIQHQFLENFENCHLCLSWYTSVIK